MSRQSKRQSDPTTTDPTTDPTTTDQGDPTTDPTTTDQGDPTTTDQGDPTTDPTTDPTKGATAPAAVDPLETFGAAWTSAVNNAEGATGAVPAVDVDAVLVAYRAIPAGKRATTMAAASSGTMVSAMADPTNPNVPAMQAAGILMAALAAHGTKAAVAAVPEVSPVESLRDALAILGGARYVILSMAAADLTEEEINAAAIVSDEIVNAFMESGAMPERLESTGAAILALLAGKPARKRSTSTGTQRAPRLPGAGNRDLGAMIRDAVAASTGHVLTIAETKKAIDSAGGAVDNRHAKNNVDGIRADVRDGKKVFVLA